MPITDINKIREIHFKRNNIRMKLIDMAGARESFQLAARVKELDKSLPGNPTLVTLFERHQNKFVRALRTLNERDDLLAGRVLRMIEEAYAGEPGQACQPKTIESQLELIELDREISVGPDRAVRVSGGALFVDEIPRGGQAENCVAALVFRLDNLESLLNHKIVMGKRFYVVKRYGPNGRAKYKSSDLLNFRFAALKKRVRENPFLADKRKIALIEIRLCSTEQLNDLRASIAEPLDQARRLINEIILVFKQPKSGNIVIEEISADCLEINYLDC
jgi:hypothetical protein